MDRRLNLLRSLLATWRGRALLTGSTLATALGVSCAIGVDPNADTGPGGGDATMMMSDSTMPGTDIGPSVDAYSCTGSTCTVAHGTGACVAGHCQIGACEMGYSDLDHSAINGCECMAGMVSSNCGTPTDLGMLAVGGMRMVTGLLPTAMAEHWVRVNFVPGGHAHIQFSTNPGMAYHFDVDSSCMPGSALHCPDRTSGAAGLTNWEFFAMAADGGGNDPDAGMTPSPTTVLIHITTAMPPTTCMPYILAVTN